MSFRGMLTSCFPSACLDPGNAALYHDPDWADIPSSSGSGSESNQRGSTEMDNYDNDNTLISNSDLNSALLHQYREEKRLLAIEKQETERDIKPAKSFQSVISMISTNTGMFSAATEHRGNQNKYASKSKKSRQKKKNKKKKENESRGRYRGDKYRDADSDASDGKGDWSFVLDLKDQKPIDDLTYESLHEGYQVLHLKTKACMADFYREEFLLSFPQYPIPREMQVHTMNTRFPSHMKNHDKSKSRSSPPRLTPADSDLTSSSTASEVQDAPGYADSRALNIVVDDSPFLDLAVSGSLGLIDRKRSIGPQHVEAGKRKDFVVLGNKKTGVPVAVCALKSSKGRPVVRIYTTKPRIESQEPVVHTNMLGMTEKALPLYTWAELRMRGDFPDENTKYYLHAATGVKSQFHKCPVSIACHTSPGSTELNIFSQKPGEEGTNALLALCARIVVRTESIRRMQETNYVISANKGMDIANAVYMTIIIDELMEFMMRKKCAMQAWKFANENEDSGSQDGDDEDTLNNSV